VGNDDTSEGTGDKVAAWLLYLLQLVWELALFILLIASVMAGDSCGTGAGGIAEPRVCSGMYFATIFYGFAFVLLIAAIAVPVLIIRANRRRWLRPLLGIVLLTIAAVVYVGLASQ
jgi:hypothetical protein